MGRQELIAGYPVEYIAGGATQNAIRVAQWMLQVPGAASFMVCGHGTGPWGLASRAAQGAVGCDATADKMEEVAGADGVAVNYLRADGAPTGKCAVLVVDGERSMVASLGAAEMYKARACGGVANGQAEWAS